MSSTREFINVVSMQADEMGQHLRERILTALFLAVVYLPLTPVCVLTCLMILEINALSFYL